MSTVPAAVTIVTLRQKLARVRRLHTRALRERDDARDKIVQLCQERVQLVAERDSLQGLLSGSQQELRDAITAQGKAEARLREARAAIDRVRMVRAWKNEDGKTFVFADDLRAALDGSGT